jgi:hypothetical protein
VGSRRTEFKPSPILTLSFLYVVLLSRVSCIRDTEPVACPNPPSLAPSNRAATGHPGQAHRAPDHHVPGTSRQFIHSHQVDHGNRCQLRKADSSPQV